MMIVLYSKVGVRQNYSLENSNLLVLSDCFFPKRLTVFIHGYGFGYNTIQCIY